MQREADDAEALRRRLYRPDASAADLATYLQAAAVESTPPPPEVAVPIERRPRWPFVVGIGVVVSVALLSLPLLTEPQVAPSPTVSPAAVPGSTGGAPTEAVADGGSRRGASGHATAAPHGRYLYTIATGDSVTGVASRFGLCTGDVLTALPYGVDPAALPSGQVLLLEQDAGTRDHGSAC